MKKKGLTGADMTLAIALSAITCLGMIAFPQLSLQAAKSGIALWLEVVVPALLPFFICANFMMQLGVPQKIARFFEKPVRHFFAVPGTAAFAFIMSITSGYPMGARIIADLREKCQITRAEANRMMSFCSTSGPLFMLGAVGVGLLGNVAAGWVIAISHYLGAIMNGLIFRHHGRNAKPELPPVEIYDKKNDKVKSVAIRKPQKLSMVAMLTESIFSAGKTLVLICGYIVIFSLIVQFLDIFVLQSVFTSPLPTSIIKGVFEFTVGTASVAELGDVTLLMKCIICTAIISWGGISTHFQVASLVGKTDINMGFYVRAKLCHAILSAMVAFSLGPVIFKLAGMPSISTVFALSVPTSVTAETLTTVQIFFNKLLFSSEMIIILMIVFIVISIVGKMTYQIGNWIKALFAKQRMNKSRADEARQRKRENETREA